MSQPFLGNSPRLRLALLASLALGTPAFAQSVNPVAPSAVQDETVELEAFVVNALTDERNRSVEAKRNADSIGDFLSPDRLGLFVDDNIGAVVERLPGVYTSGAGQSGGSGISIRGLGGGFNSLQVDGDRLPSNQGGTRGVSIDNIPAELIGGIEISKAPTPDKEADSIGGVVNVETKSGLDLNRRLIATRLTYGFDDYGDGDQWSASLSYTDRLSDKVGIFFSYSQRENTRLRDELRADPGDALFDQLVTTNLVGRIDEDVDPTIYTPGRIDNRRTLQSQQNTGANLNLDFQLTSSWRLSLRSFYAKFEEQRPQIRNTWRFDRSDGGDPDGERFDDGDFVYLDEASGTVYFGNDQRIQRRIADQDETEDIVRLQLAGSHTWSDSRLDYSASLGRAQREFTNDIYNFDADDIQMFVNFNDARRPQVGVINPGDFFYFTDERPRVPDFNDPSYFGRSGDGYFNAVERRAELIDAEDEIRTFALDYRNLTTGGLTFKVGAKLRQQEKDNQRDFVISPGFTFAAANGTFDRQDGFFNGQQDLGLFPTYAGLSQQNPVRPRQFVSDVLSGTPSADNRRDSVIQDLGAAEDVVAAYAQASKTFGRLTLLGGARWERTESDYRGFTADVTGNPAIDTPRRVEGSRTYDGLYPSLHANIAVGENTSLRLSAGRTLARPEFQDLTPSSFATLSVDSGSGSSLVNLQRGNAGLEPTQSVNYDLSLEHYFQDGGLVSLAVFRKELSNWIYRSSFIAPASQFPEYAAIPNLSGVRVASTLNGDRATVTGFELNAEKSIGGGFSIGANYTQLSFDVNTAQTGLDRVPGQSDRLIRASLNYERDRFIARLSYRDSGNILDSQLSFSDSAAVNYFQGLGLGQITTDANADRIINLGLYEKTAPALELYAEYRLTKGISLFIQGGNLLGENELTLLEEDDRFVEKYEYRSWSALFGVKANF